MVDTNVVQAAQGASKMGWFGMISYGFLSLFVILLVLNSIYIGLQSHSIVPVLKNLGDTFLLSTQHISDISKQIIANDGAYIRTDDFWTGVGNYIWLYAKLFIYLYTIYGWLKIIFLLLHWGPIYTGDHKFSLLLLTLGLFFGLQMLILLGNAAITKNLDCFSSCEESVVNTILTPFTWIWDFIRALPLILKPGMDVSNKIMGNATIY